MAAAQITLERHKSGLSRNEARGIEPTSPFCMRSVSLVIVAVDFPDRSAR